jgi:hypothetical protein
MARRIKRSSDPLGILNFNQAGGLTNSSGQLDDVLGAGPSKDYTEFRKKQEQQNKAQAKQKAAEQLATKQKQDWNKKNWFEKGIAGVAKAFSPEGLKKNVSDIGRDAKTYLVDEPIKSVQNAVAQAQMGQRGAGDYRSEKLIEARNKFAEEDFKAGKISKQQRDKAIAENNKRLKNTQDTTKKLEKEFGRKYNQDQGAIDALATITSVDGVPQLIKGTVKAAGKAISKTIDKMGGKNAAKDVAEANKADVESIIRSGKETTKPSGTLANASQELPTTKTPSTKSAAKTEITEEPIVRSSNYKLDSAKPRVSADEATNKLKSAGYTTEESKAILADTLSNKGLSMPGSPKKIGYDENSIVEAARNYDGEAIVLPESTSLKPLKSVDGNTSVGTSKLGQSVLSEAQSAKLISKTEAEATDLPQYNKANMKDQAQYATDLIKNDPQAAIDIAMGRKSAPEHILSQTVFNAVEAHAKAIGGEDGANLLRNLARSKQVGNLTKMGQEIRAAAERDPHSPVNLMNEVKLNRMEKLKRNGKNISKEQKADAKAIKASTPKVKKEDWDSFVKGITC